MEYLKGMETQERTRLRFPHKKVGILGGTFNPPHTGHVDMARHVKREFMLDEVFLMPCGTPPHKTEDIAPAPMRLKMTQLCVDGCDGLDVLDIETRRKGYTYTVDTMRELRKKNPHTDYYFIVGADTVFELASWYQCRELFSLTRFVCVRRGAYDTLKLSAEIARLQEEYGACVFLSEYTGLFVSSSYIRQRRAQGKSIEGLVPKNVEEYIIANGLYR
ncbi:putative nicotinate-nucleotide adenylyltransferase [Christensenellaceae bacterium]|nr:putative nicotinate-nucleotide adenylyltransferase [Christensenellaceae bacterium]BDF62190.1 putative nicotinate-nucleotide adenylyltransferase [Christensenellaceae bacterium]